MPTEQNTRQVIPSGERWRVGNVTMETFVICGPVVHSRTWDNITIIENGFVAIDKGKIIACGTVDSLTHLQTRLNISTAKMFHLGHGQFLMPGMIDTHIHAPQYPNAGLGLDKPLLEWLNLYTYPLEEKFEDVQLAEEVYKAVVKRTLSNGTTTACYYATIHPEACLVLADQCAVHGQRAFVGKVNMNQCSPQNYVETSEESIKNTRFVVEQITKKNNPLVKPIITPRFAVSCDMPLMKELSVLAAGYDVRIQTHISENTEEVELVNEMYPDNENYADVYDSAKLLNNKTILAHGIYLNDEEVKLIARRGCAVSHCPLSNTSLKSGNCNVRRLVEAGVTVGLGTDVSGGYSPSMLVSMRACIDVSVQLTFHSQALEPLTFHHAFYLATLGGAHAVSLGDKIGNFEVGKDFDALVISTTGPDSPIDLLPVSEYSTMELVQKFVYLGDDRNISQVFVMGKLVKNVDAGGTQFYSDEEVPTFFSQ